MKIALLDAKGTARTLKRLIAAHDIIHIAVAWGYDGALADHLLKHRQKFRSIMIGLNGFATSPDLVDRIVKMKNVYGKKARTGLFHPKIYYFETGDRAEAIVGSANFTEGGLGRNVEAGIHLAGDAKADVFKKLRSELKTYQRGAFGITNEIAKAYRRQHKIACANRGPKDPALPTDKKEWARVNSELATMEWRTFSKAARAEEYYAKRIRLLNDMRARLEGARSLTNLNSAEWKAIAGVIGKRERLDAELPDLDWGLFGSMGGSGEFAKRIRQQNVKLATAFDLVPRAGEVTHEDFGRFVAIFLEAFEGASRIGGVPTATRLLAMKRPDAFVCVNDMNRRAIADALGFSYSTLGLDNYWERVIEPMRTAPWYNVPRPDGRDGVLWDYRAAMLDALYYDPDAKS